MSVTTSCFEGFEALHARRRGHVQLAPLVPGSPPSDATTPHERARAVAAALHTLDTRLTRTA